MGEIINPYKNRDGNISSLDLIKYGSNINREYRRRNVDELYNRSISKLWKFPVVSKFGKGYREIDPKEICGCLKILKDAFDVGYVEKEYIVPFFLTIIYISKFNPTKQKKIIIDWRKYKILRTAAKGVLNAGN
jgi:hypothetical protein